MSTYTDNPFLILNLGADGVGKSALTIRLITGGIFAEKYDPTVEDTYRRPEEVNGRREMLEILDTAGDDSYNPIRELYYKKADGFLLIYSITDRASFEKIKKIYERIIFFRQYKVPIVVVGNKCDLTTSRQVSTQEGKGYADVLHVPFYETSAKTPMNVTEVYVEIAKEIQRAKAAAGLLPPKT